MGTTDPHWAEGPRLGPGLLESFAVYEMVLVLMLAFWSLWQAVMTGALMADW